MSDYRQKSWWLESLPREITPNPPLTGREKADVVIIGGGYTGLSTGYHLKQFKPDMDVRLIESDVCGYGASGRNGGFSMTLFGLTKGITKFRFNDEKARSAHVYMENAVDYLHDVITQNHIDCDYERSGYLLVGTSPSQVKRVEHDFHIMEKWGLGGVERWDRARLAEEFNTDFYQLGWFEPRCGILNPARLARGLKEPGRKPGGDRLREFPGEKLRPKRRRRVRIHRKDRDRRNPCGIPGAGHQCLLHPVSGFKKAPVSGIHPHCHV